MALMMMCGSLAKMAMKGPFENRTRTCGGRHVRSQYERYITQRKKKFLQNLCHPSMTVFFRNYFSSECHST